MSSIYSKIVIKDILHMIQGILDEVPISCGDLQVENRSFWNDGDDRYDLKRCLQKWLSNKRKKYICIIIFVGKNVCVFDFLHFTIPKCFLPTKIATSWEPAQFRMSAANLGTSPLAHVGCRPGNVGGWMLDVGTLHHGDPRTLGLWLAGKSSNIIWLVVWLPFFIFPYIGNNHPNWLIFFRGIQTTNQFVGWFINQYFTPHFYTSSFYLPFIFSHWFLRQLSHATLSTGGPILYIWCSIAMFEGG